MLWGVKQVRGKISHFLALNDNISKTVGDTSKVTISIGKYICAFDWHKIDDLELYKFEFSENFEGFRRYRTQQQLNE